MSNLRDRDTRFGSVFGTQGGTQSSGVERPFHAYENLGPLKGSSPLSGSGGTGVTDAAIVTIQPGGVPTQIGPSGTFSVNVQFKNTGTTTWTVAGGYVMRFVGTGSFTPTTTSVGGDVAPNATKTFPVTFAAPSAPGTYDFALQMSKTGPINFGEVTAVLQVTVSASQTLDGSRFVQWVLAPPSTMQVNQTYPVRARWVNTGYTTWTDGAGYGLNAVGTMGAAVQLGVSPGSVFPTSIGEWQWSIKAPSAAGSYTVQYQTSKNGITFGERSSSIPVTVNGVPTSTLNAQQWSQDCPTVMQTAQTVAVTVVMLNTGNVAWIAGTHQLKQLGDIGPAFVALAAGPVNPGYLGSFTFNITSAGTPGVQYFEYVMEDGAGLEFGGHTERVEISVGPTGAADDAGIVGAEVQSGTHTIYNGAPPGSDREYTIGVTFRNAGTNTWGAPYSCRRIDANPQTGIDLVYVSGSTNPDTPSSQSTTFWMTVRNNNTVAGTVTYQFRMHNGTVYFGDTMDVAFVWSSGRSPDPVLATIRLDNIVDGLRLDGTQGGTVSGSTITFAKYRSACPEDKDFWATADSSRTINVQQIGGSATWIRVYGCDWWGRNISERIQSSPGAVVTGKRSFWKVSYVVAEQTSTAQLYLGWSDQVQFGWPIKVFSASGSGTDTAYLLRVWKDGVLQTIGTGAGGTYYKTVPANEDPCGVICPGWTLDGRAVVEVEYVVDSQTANSSAAYRSLVADGTIVEAV